MLIRAAVRTALTYFTWGLLAAVLAGLGVWMYVNRHVDDEIRHQAEVLLARRFPRLAVSVDSARLVDGEGIYLRGLHLRQPGNEDSRSALATIDELFLECDTSLQRLVQGDLRPRRVVLRRPHLRLARLADGSWNVAGLVPERCGDSAEQPPAGEIEGGTLEVTDTGPNRHCTLRDINLTLAATRDEQGPLLRITGGFLNEHLRQAEIGLDHRCDLRTTAGRIKLSGLEISSELLAALPREAAEQAGLLAALHARADVDLSLAYAAGQPQPWRFQANVQIHDGRLEHPRLPYSLSQLQADLSVGTDGWELKKFTASNRQTTLSMTARRQGWAANAPMVVRVEGRQVLLDQRMLDALPSEAQVVWRQFSPEGEADVDATFSFDGSAWHPEATITTRNVTATYFRFPYPVQHGAGVLTVKDKNLFLDFAGKARGVPVHVKGEIHDFGPPGSGHVDIDGERLHGDAEMIAAMPPEARGIAQAFNPTGMFGCHVGLWWQPNDPEVHRTMKLRVYEAFGRYERFRYPLNSISGLIEQLSDNEWRFSDMKAVNGAGRITCSGSVKTVNVGAPAAAGGVSPSAAKDDLVELHITGEQITLDEQLRDALPPATRRLWTILKPQGLVNLDVALRFLAAQDRMDLTVGIAPRNDTVSFEPAAFAYRWEKLRGQMNYHNGLIDLQGVQATHGDTAWQARGQAQVSPDGSWGLTLNNLHVDRLHVDRDLLRAMPENLRHTLTDLNPAGAFNVSGGMSLAQGPRPGEPPRAAWNLDVNCHRNSLQAGVKLDDIFGSVHLEGQSENGQVRGGGQLAIESLSYRGYQFTDVRGPFTIQPDLILLGTPREPQLRPVAGHISAHCYDGTIYGDGWVRREKSPSGVGFQPAEQAGSRSHEGASSMPWLFSLRANLAQANLGRFAREALVGRQNISGRVDGSIVLNGTSQGVRDLNGVGILRLRDTNIYELPVMLSLLKVLSLKEPDLTAFTTSDIDFQINGAHGKIYLPRIDLNGDALSLSGKGEMGFDKQLALVFKPQLGSGRAKVPFISDFLRSAGGQIVDLYVGGTLDQPDVRREPFPGIKEALENLQPSPLLPQMNPVPSTLRPNLLSPRR